MTEAPTWLVTRPQPQAGEWVRQLAERGLQAVALPLLAVGPVADPVPLRAVRDQCPSGSLVMFVSPNAVLQARAVGFFDRPWPAGVLAAATGPGTVEALRAAGVPAAQTVAPPGPPYDSEHLWQGLRSQDWAGRPVWIVRGEGGRDWFGDTLVAAGAQVARVQGYARGCPVWGAAERAVLGAALARPAAHVWLFSSSEAVGHLHRLAPGVAWSAARALATHPRIAQAARDAGFGQVGLIDVGIEALVRFAATGAPIQSSPNGEP